MHSTICILQYISIQIVYSLLHIQKKYQFYRYPYHVLNIAWIHHSQTGAACHSGHQVFVEQPSRITFKVCNLQNCVCRQSKRLVQCCRAPCKCQRPGPKNMGARRSAWRPRILLLRVIYISAIFNVTNFFTILHLLDWIWLF